MWSKRWIFNYEKLKELNPERKNNGDLKQMKDAWNFPLVQGKERIKGKDGKAIHPTQKPEKMLNWN
jgi:site-specific DNA-methyltransferase (adenine-specific)